MKFLTDNIEDTKVGVPSYFSSNHVSSYKFDYIEEEQVIREDNNENNLEAVETMKKSHSNKKLETFLDKSENFGEQHDIKKPDNIIIESIKEENIEEEEITNFHQGKNCEIPLSDELAAETSKMRYRLSMKTTSLEENKINEINEINENEDEN